MQTRVRLIAASLTILASAVALHAGSLSGTVKSDGSGASVVYLEPASTPAATRVAAKTYTLTQHGMKFVPDVLAIPPGSTVTFKNDDGTAHNVFWASIGGDRRMAKNLGTFSKGEQRAFKFDQVGVAPLLCNVHPEMEGYIVVSPTPYAARTDSAGGYRIADIPDGRYKVTAWHAGKKPVSKAVTIDQASREDFDLSR